MSNQVCILDYGSGNVKSVENLVKFLGFDAKISNKEADILEASHLIMPGVGSFEYSMIKIKEKIPISILENEVLINKKKFMGICVGMQVLVNYGYENGKFEGLGWVNGTVKKLEVNDLSLPHIGWNNCEILKDDKIFSNLNDIRDFYFLHSYAVSVENDNHIIATSKYGNNFCSVLKKDNIYGIQFHPEKSQKAGMILIKNFLNLS